MARKALKTSDGEGFLRALWDLVEDMKAEYGVECRFRVRGTTRKGVFEFQMKAHDVHADSVAPARAMYTAEYPNVMVGSLEAFLYRSALKLDYQLEMQRKYPSGKA